MTGEVPDLEESRILGAVKSAARVLEVLECFAEQRIPLTVNEVCKALDYPQSSTSVLLRSLQHLGYLSYDPERRRFWPTVRVAILGGWINEAFGPAESVTQMMEQLRRLTGQTVILAQQNGIHVQYVSILLGDAPERVHIRTGTLRPICRAALGKSLLIPMGDMELGRLVRRLNADARERGVALVDLKLLRDELDQARSLGYTRSLGSVRPGRDVIAMTIGVPAGHPPLAIGIAGPLAQMSARQDEIIDALKQVVETHHGAEPQLRRPTV